MNLTVVKFENSLRASPLHNLDARNTGVVTHYWDRWLGPLPTMFCFDSFAFSSTVLEISLATHARTNVPYHTREKSVTLHGTYNTSGDHSQNTGDLAFKLTANGSIETVLRKSNSFLYYINQVQVPMMHLHQCFILESIKHKKTPPKNHEKHMVRGA